MPIDPWPGLLAEVQTGYDRFDEQLRTWQAAYARRGGHLHCRRGCRNCCSLAVHSTFTEALGIAPLLSAEQEGKIAAHAEKIVQAGRSAADLKGWLRACRERVGSCPLLTEDGACGVYPVRPFACRSLLSTRPADWCGVDLSLLHPLEQQAFLGSLDREVVDWPTHYATAPREFGQTGENEAAWRLRETFGFSLRGNLPLLLWLETEHRLSELIRGGRGAVAEFFSGRKLLIPWLIDLGPDTD